VKEHRFVVVFRGPGLSGNVKDTDPQAVGVPPLAAEAQDDASRKTAEVANQWIAAATKLLAGEKKASGLTLRGFAERPNLPSYEEVYGLKAAAASPSIRCTRGSRNWSAWRSSATLRPSPSRLTRAGENWDKYDFFFLHYKYTDSTGEDGNFAAKVQRIEELDAAIPRITALKPTVLIVTGDHSTPSFLKSHSWHPVPTLLVSDCCRPDGNPAFGERNTIRGGLGQFEAKYLMTLALANAGRLGKYGA
jgi:2,3-bisphosphoglycerate-independent phosphoglycerate mutase